MSKITKTEIVRDFLRTYPNKDQITSIRKMARIIYDSEVGHLFNERRPVDLDLLAPRLPASAGLG